MSPNGNMERMLESAVIVCWDELMHGASHGRIHIEYDFAVGGTLDRLKVWSSCARGRWLLVCEYWMSASGFHAAGLGFSNEYQSECLAHVLDRAMQQQNAFELPPDLGRQGLLQISAPTAEETAVAAALIGAFDRMASCPTVA